MLLRLVKMRPSSPRTPSSPVPPEIQSLPVAADDVVVLAVAEDDVVARHAVDDVVAGLAVDLVGAADVGRPRAASVEVRAARRVVEQLIARGMILPRSGSVDAVVVYVS